jgi:hypothetical protein
MEVSIPDVVFFEPQRQGGTELHREVLEFRVYRLSFHDSICFAGFVSFAPLPARPIGQA